MYHGRDSAAVTLTAGNDCVVAGFVKMNVTVHSVPDTVPLDAAVSTSVPELCVHTLVVHRTLDVDVTGKDDEAAVCEPVNPGIVTVESSGRSMSADSVIVSVLLAPDTRVLCWIDLTLNCGTTTRRGSVHSVTPYSAVAGFVMAAWAISRSRPRCLLALLPRSPPAMIVS